MDASLSCGSRVFGGVGMPPRRVDRVIRVNQAYQGNGQALSQRGGEGGWEDGRIGEHGRGPREVGYNMQLSTAYGGTTR